MMRPESTRRMIRRATATLAILVVVCVASMAAAVVIGPSEISFCHLLGILGSYSLGTPTGDWEPWQEVIVLQVRMPRALVGFLVGGGLAICGAVMQGIFRNPMADPGIIGVSGGASFGAVVAIAAGWSANSQLWIPACAFLGALACTFFVYTLATTRGRTSVTTLLLSGIAVSTVAVAASSFLLTQALPVWDVGRAMISWLMGTLDGRTWWHVRVAAPMILIGSLALFAYARALNVLTMGEEVALTLGVAVSAVRRNVLILASVVASAAVAVSGTIAFIGLVVPHMLRLILGPDHRVLLPASFLGGAGLLVLADIVSRVLIPQKELQIGVLTSLMGGPFFIYLLIVHKGRVREL